jgi:hypothetical protein
MLPRSALTAAMHVACSDAVKRFGTLRWSGERVLIGRVGDQCSGSGRPNRRSPHAASREFHDSGNELHVCKQEIRYVNFLRDKISSSKLRNQAVHIFPKSVSRYPSSPSSEAGRLAEQHRRR